MSKSAKSGWPVVQNDVKVKSWYVVLRPQFIPPINFIIPIHLDARLESRILGDQIELKSWSGLGGSTYRMKIFIKNLYWIKLFLCAFSIMHKNNFVKFQKQMHKKFFLNIVNFTIYNKIIPNLVTVRRIRARAARETTSHNVRKREISKVIASLLQTIGYNCFGKENWNFLDDIYLFCFTSCKKLFPMLHDEFRFNFSKRLIQVKTYKAV